MGFTLSQKITGAERKVIASIIAEATGNLVRYAGVPTYTYEIGDWSIDRNSVVKSPRTDISEMETIIPIIEALKTVGFTAEDDLTVTLSAEGHTSQTLRNLGALIASKGSLLTKALGRETGLSMALWEELLEGEEVPFPFFNATLNYDEIRAYITLVHKLSELAKSLKYVSAKEKPVENMKYAFRCFLLRLGFIGEKYKSERKVLLKNFTGSGAYKNK